MVTRRVRPGDTIARIALFGALALAVVFGAVAFDSIGVANATPAAHHAAIIGHDARPIVVAANTSRSRGGAWLAWLLAASALAALAISLLGADRRAGHHRNAAKFSIRLRAPPILHVAR